jgi:hypothetical protein
MSPPSCPRTFPYSGARFPARGPSGRFLRFAGTTGTPTSCCPSRATSLPSLHATSRTFGFAAACVRRNAHGPGLCYLPDSPPPVSSTETTESPRFLENPNINVPCPATPARPLRSATTALSVPASAKQITSSLATNTNFGAQSHGLCARCLRFAGWSAPPPRKARLRMAGQPFRAGLDTRWVLIKGFRSFHSPSQTLLGALEIECRNHTGAAGKPVIELFSGASQLSLWSAQTAGQAGPNRITQCDFSTSAWQDFTGHVRF